MIAVWTVTGKPMLVGKAVLDPIVPTLFNELPEEVAFQAVNLRIEEVSGPSSPSLGGGAWRDEDGETHGSSSDVSEEVPAGITIEAYDALVSERDTLRTQLTKIHGDLNEARLRANPSDEDLGEVAKERGFVLVSDRDHDTLTQAIVDLTSERDAARTDLAEANDAKAAAEGQIGDLRTQIESSAAELAPTPPPVDPNPALMEAIDAVLAASATTLERLPEDALGKLAKLKGIDPMPDSKAKLVEALKPAG